MYLYNYHQLVQLTYCKIEVKDFIHYINKSPQPSCLQRRPFSFQSFCLFFKLLQMEMELREIEKSQQFLALRRYLTYFLSKYLTFLILGKHTDMEKYTKDNKFFIKNFQYLSCNKRKGRGEGGKFRYRFSSSPTYYN